MGDATIAASFSDVQDSDTDVNAGFPTLLPPSNPQRKRTGSLDSASRSTGSVSFLDPPSSLGSDATQHRSGSAPPLDKRQDPAYGTLSNGGNTMTSKNTQQLEVRQAPHRETRTGTITSLGPAAGQTTDTSSGSNDAPVIEPLLLDGLRVQKDRMLLLRSDLEIERFVNDPSRTRLRIAPPTFPPNLNSYQRLLIHRLADMWNVTRELESALTAPQQQQQGGGAANQGQSKGSEIIGVIVLVKNDKTKHPPIRLASLIPSVPADSNTMPAFSAIQQPQHDPNMMAMLAANTAALSIAPGVVASSSLTHVTSPQNLPGILPIYAEAPTSSSSAVSVPSSTSSQGAIRIMSRSAGASGGSSQSSGSRSGSAANTAMTFEEREAAYQEARMRIFNQSNENSNLQPQVPQGTTMYYPLDPAVRQQQAMVLPDIPVNTLRPSAPAFVYQQVPQYTQPPPQQQQYAFYAVPIQPQPFVQGAPPIEVTMPSPAVTYAQQVAYPGYGPAPGTIDSIGHPSTSATPQPLSVRSQSPPESTLSTATSTSTSSVRTASTSSARRSKVGGHRTTALELDLRPIRKTGTKTHPTDRQARPSIPTTVGSSRSARSVTSGNSRHSHSSSSVSTSTSTSLTGSAASVGGNSLTTRSSSSKGKGKEVAALADNHLSLPQKPDWLPGKKSATTSDQAEAVDVASEIAPANSASALAPDDSLRSSTSSQPAASSPTPSLDGTPHSRTLADLPAALTPPAAPSSAASDAGSSIAPSESASQVQSKPKKSAQTQQKIVEYPPLRYDPAKGWTTLDGGASVASPILSSGHVMSAQSAAKSAGKGARANNQQNQRKQHQQHQQQQQVQQPYHGQPYFPSSPHLQHQQPYLQQSQGYPVQMQYSHMQPAQIPSNAQQQPYYYPQPYLQQAGPSADLSQQQLQYPQQQPQQGQAYGGAYHYISVPVQYVTQDQPQYYPQQQPVHGQPFSYGAQQMQPVPMPIQQQPFPLGGMTAADILASGEMLYSHDVPRPVPRSGATLFDPNASSRVASS